MTRPNQRQPEWLAALIIAHVGDEKRDPVTPVSRRRRMLRMACRSLYPRVAPSQPNEGAQAL